MDQPVRGFDLRIFQYTPVYLFSLRISSYNQMRRKTSESFELFVAIGVLLACVHAYPIEGNWTVTHIENDALANDHQLVV